MLVLQQISRNVRINSLVVRYISTTKVRQDDEKSLSDSQKEQIREKLKGIKKKLLQQEGKAEQTPAAFVKPEESANAIGGKSSNLDSDSKTKSKEKQSLIKQTTNKLKGSKQKALLRGLETEDKKQSESHDFSEKDLDIPAKESGKQEKLVNKKERKEVSLKELLRRDDVEKKEEPEPEPVHSETEMEQEYTLKQRQDVKKQKAKLKNLLEERDEIVEEPGKEDIPVKESGEKEDDANKLKGKMKLQELFRQSENFSVEDKVQVPHPVRKIRPVQKAAKKAESNEHIKLLRSIKEVADELGGDADKTEKELMDAVFKSTASEASEKKRLQEPGKDNMSSIIGDLNVDLSKGEKEIDPNLEIKRTLAMIKKLQGKSDVGAEDSEQKDYRKKYFPLFDAQPLNIFDGDYLSNLNKETPKLEVYDKIQEKEVQKLVTHSPANIYEEMIKWTKEGKLWHFPIDNEWKWSWEENVEFTEHILLERHLESWCPTGGPIRHFMELVCVGLSKNPYIPAEEKREHIYWFKDYFEEKRRLLEDVGAFKVEKVQIEQGKEVS